MNSRTITVLVFVVVILLVGLFASGGFSSTDNRSTDTSTTTNATTTEQAENDTNLTAELEKGVYEIDSNESTVEWTARKELVDGYEDTGMFPVSGSITVASTSDQEPPALTENLVTDAAIIFDIDGLSVTSVSNSELGTSRLANHLRSEDFFAAEEYPEATLEITEVEPVRSPETMPVPKRYTVTADLTMKGATNEITFPATIGMQDGRLIVSADTEIDRTRWNIKYGSDSFFDNLGDNVIDDTVDLSARLIAESATDTETN